MTRDEQLVEWERLHREEQKAATKKGDIVKRLRVRVFGKASVAERLEAAAEIEALRASLAWAIKGAEISLSNKFTAPADGAAYKEARANLAAAKQLIAVKDGGLR